MSFDQRVEFQGLSVEWDCRFDDVSGAFVGWFPREGSPLGEGFSLIYLRFGPSGQAGNGWYLEGPNDLRELIGQLPPFRATLEAATRRLVELAGRNPHILTVEVDDEGLLASCSCGKFEFPLGPVNPTVDDLVRIQNEHRSKTTT